MDFAKAVQQLGGTPVGSQPITPVANAGTPQQMGRQDFGVIAQQLGGTTIGSNQTNTPSVPGVAFPSNPNDTPFEAGAKTVGNLPGSTYNFAKGAVQSLNPVTAINNLGEISKNQNQVSVTDVGKEIPKQAYEMLVPNFIKHLFGGNTQGAQQDVTNDPVGSIAPIIFAADGVTKGIDAKFGTTSNVALDSSISKTASVVTKPVAAATNAVSSFGSGLTRSIASHLTGLDSNTISQIVQNPEAFAKLQQEQVTRGGLAGEFGTTIDALHDTLKETGSGYDNVRALPNTVAVPENFIHDTLQKFGLKLEPVAQKLPEGELPTIDFSPAENPTTAYKVVSDTTSSTRNTSDINAIQKFVDNWGSKTNLTSQEFLNMRSDLADLANYDKMTGMGKTKESQVIADSLRQEANRSMRPQIDGLKELDSSYSEKISQFNQIKKDFLQKDVQGNYTFKDGAINKIANAVGKGKDQLLARMEEVSPGITKRIQILKAVEDIERAKENKVGTYARGAIEGFGAVTGNIPAIVSAIVTNPTVAVPLIRGLGYTAAQLAPIISKLKVIAGDVNHLRVVSPYSTKSSVPTESK